jgi:hypothetical protein
MNFAVEIVTRGVDYTRFRRVYNSEEFNREVAQAAKLKERSLVEHTKTADGKEHKRVRITPNIALPGPVQKLFPEGQFSYEEVTVLDPQSRTATYAIETTVGDKIQVTGLAKYIEESGAVRLRFEGEANVKMFGVGTMVEKYLIGEVKTRYELVQRLLQAFVDEGRDTNLTPSIPVPR